MTTIKFKLYKIIVLVSCLIFLLPASNYAQKAIVKYNIAGLFNDTYGGAVEVKIAPQITAQFAANLVRQKKLYDGGTYNILKNGYNLQPEFRYYFDTYKNAPNGIFVGLNLFFEKKDAEVRTLAADSLVLSGNNQAKAVGINVGYQIIAWQHMAVELSINPRYVWNTTTGNGTVPQMTLIEEKQGFLFNKIGLFIGFAF